MEVRRNSDKWIASTPLFELVEINHSRKIQRRFRQHSRDRSAIGRFVVFSATCDNPSQPVELFVAATMGVASCPECVRLFLFFAPSSGTDRLEPYDLVTRITMPVAIFRAILPAPVWQSQDRGGHLLCAQRKSGLGK
jgi:hypothetical protein